VILLITGNGKGKTTAALGQGLRVYGGGGRVVCFQFIKSPKWPAGEEKAIEKLGAGFRLIKGGRGFVGIMGDKLPFSVHQKAALETLQKARRAILSGKYNLVILDEVNVALSLKLIKLKNVLALVKKTPPKTDLLLTGRYAPKALFRIADIATEMMERKHPYKKGIQGKRGREY
jgi:cob(I)alamin adenosyltransferase